MALLISDAYKLPWKQTAGLLTEMAILRREPPSGRRPRNIFIDFEQGGLLREIFTQSDSIGVPDLLFEEELRGQHAHLLEHGLQLLELAGPAIRRTYELARRHRRPSRLDLAALALAEQERCPLLTGDRHLRLAAEAENVEVRGTLWLAEKLVTEGVVSSARLRAAYERMRAGGRRLPWAEIERQLRRLEEARASVALPELQSLDTPICLDTPD